MRTMTLHLFGLLTRIRLTGRELDLLSAARQQYLFPLIGIVVGLLASLAIIALDFLLGPTNTLVSGSLVLVFLYGVTGIMHTEGLADLADGMMTSGDADRKRDVMKDPHVGVAAVLAASMFLIVFFALLTRMCAGAGEASNPWPNLWEVPFVLGMVVSEVAG